MAAKRTGKSKQKTTELKPLGAARTKASLALLLAPEIEKASALSATYAKRYPDQPVAVTIAEGLRLAELSKGKVTALARVGVDPALVRGLPARVQLLVQRETAWNKARAKNTAGLSPARIKEAEAFKSRVFAGARFLLRRDAVVQQELDQISMGTGVADLAEDLGALGELVLAHPQVFRADPTFPKDAATKCEQLAQELAVGLDPVEAAEALEARNRAFWLLVEAISEVRAALRYLWRDKPTLLATLGVSYVAATRKAARQKRAAAPGGQGGPAPKPA